MFGRIINKLKRKATTATDGVLASTEQEKVEAMMAASVLVAYDDGELADIEIDKVVAVVNSTEELEQMGEEPLVIFDQYCDLVEASPRRAKLDLMAKLEPMKDDPTSARHVMFLAIDVAEASEEEDSDNVAEINILKEIARAMDIKLSDYINTRGTSPGRASSRA